MKDPIVILFRYLTHDRAFDVPGNVPDASRSGIRPPDVAAMNKVLNSSLVDAVLIHLLIHFRGLGHNNDSEYPATPSALHLSLTLI